MKQFTQTTVRPLVDLNHALVVDVVERVQLARLTIHVDGMTLSLLALLTFVWGREAPCLAGRER